MGSWGAGILASQHINAPREAAPLQNKMSFPSSHYLPGPPWHRLTSLGELVAPSLLEHIYARAIGLLMKWKVRSQRHPLGPSGASSPNAWVSGKDSFSTGESGMEVCDLSLGVDNVPDVSVQLGPGNASKRHPSSCVPYDPLCGGE